MKNSSILLTAMLIAAFFFVGCQESNLIDPLTDSELDKMVGGYDIILVGGAPVNNGDGTYTWMWSITNTNPGNGKKGTWQDLSHWTFQPGACLVEGDIVTAFYGTDLNNMIELSTPRIENDPSTNNCFIGDVFKFNFGTSGSLTSYYKLVINKNYSVDPSAIAYWKAGPNCSSGTFDGIGCEDNPPCEWIGETAFGGNTGVNVNAPGNWFYYYVNDGSVQKLWAGQNMEAGTVQYTGGNIVITLNSGWRLKPGESESVKIAGSENAFSQRLTGNQYTYKGTSLTVPFNQFSYYMIHIDIEWEECE